MTQSHNSQVDIITISIHRNQGWWISTAQEYCYYEVTIIESKEDEFAKLKTDMQGNSLVEF